MSEERRREKDEEKKREKEEKEEEKRKGWGEKWRRDPVEAITWALILIWAGLLWLADSSGLLAGILGDDVEAWSIGLVGAGVIVILGVVLRLLVPSYRRPIMSSLIFGIILLGVGLGQLTNWVAVGALVLIAIGLSVLLSGFFRRD